MKWFLLRLNSTEPTFDHSDKVNNSEDLEKLKELGLIEYSHPVEAVQCQLCDENHEIEVYEASDGCYMAACGRSIVQISKDELEIWKANTEKLIEVIKQDLEIKGATIDETQGDKNLWKLGTGKKYNNIHFYYLPKSTPDEVYKLLNDVQDIHNVHNVILTNTAQENTPQHHNINFVNLVDMLGGAKFFDKKKLQEIVTSFRRVQFSEGGNLHIDGVLAHAFGKNNDKTYFLEKLWKNFEQPVTEDDLYKHIRKKMGSGTANTAQKYLPKVKKKIFDECSRCKDIIVQPHTGQYMMREPEG